uniref:Uncharacterized protein n=1 Tax=Glossina palpalis gambiensis TaxID=67801 RepID=A0A1B0BQY4_9MUSC
MLNFDLFDELTEPAGTPIAQGIQYGIILRTSRTVTASLIYIFVIKIFDDDLVIFEDVQKRSGWHNAIRQGSWGLVFSCCLLQLLSYMTDID